MVFCFCPSTPPEKVKSKGFRGGAMKSIVEKQNNPHQFALGLKDACCTEPCCCILAGCGAPCGFTACWARNAVLAKYETNGADDYVCCQGYVPKCCCCDWPNCCKGSMFGLCLEGCCCPMFSLSMARIHMMDKKQIRPDSMDYQIIACSNCLQLISCILQFIAIFVKEVEEAAIIVDLIADLFTCSVAGCMGAQVHHEIKKDADGIKYVVAQGVPVVQGHNPAGAPESEEMAR